MMNKEEQILIINDRIETFKDFTINLIYCIKHYYLDKDSLSNEKDMKNHFNFCYNKICDDFIKEEINFKENEELRKYFWDYFSNQFYKSDNSINISLHIKLWEDILDIKKHMNKNNLAVLIELYEIFNESLERKINKKILK
jgi:hypothetical protein